MCLRVYSKVECYFITPPVFCECCGTQLRAKPHYGRIYKQEVRAKKLEWISAASASSSSLPRISSPPPLLEIDKYYADLDLEMLLFTLAMLAGMWKLFSWFFRL